MKKLAIIASPSALSRIVKAIAALALATLASSCFIPDNFVLQLDVPSATQARWSFDGEWQFFYAGYDPRRDTIPSDSEKEITEALEKFLGSLSVSHLRGNVWKQSIDWRVRLLGSRGFVFPTGEEWSSDNGYWIIRVTPESPTSVLIETVDPLEGEQRQGFLDAGYKSHGTIRLKTSGKVQQLSGTPLQKSWFGFGDTYSADWGIFDPVIKIRVTW